MSRLTYTVHLPESQRISWAPYLDSRRMQTTDLNQLYSFVDVAALLMRRGHQVLGLRSVTLDPRGFQVALNHDVGTLTAQPRLVLAPGMSGLHFDSGELSRDTTLLALVPPALLLLLGYEWLGREALTTEWDGLPEYFWVQVYYAYLDLMGQTYAYHLGFDVPHATRLIPDLDEGTLEYDAFIEPRFGNALVMAPPLPGSLARRDSLLFHLGLSSSYIPDEPLLLKNPEFYLKRILTRTRMTPIDPAESSAEPLAALVDHYQHSAYTQLLELMRHYPVVFAVRRDRGAGTSYMIQQAAQQLVQGTSIVFTNNLYEDSNQECSLHPSIEHAYRNGGVVVLASTSSTKMPRGCDVALAVLANQPVLGLQRAERPLVHHADFRLVVELSQAAMTELYRRTSNPALSAYAITIARDEKLWSELSSSLVKSKQAGEALMLVLACLPEHTRYSLHLYQALATTKDLGHTLLQILHGNPDVKEGLEENEVVAKAFATLEKVQTGKVRASSKKPAAVKEEASAQEKQAALQELVQPTPTVQPTLLPEPDSAVDSLLPPESPFGF